MNLHVTSRHDGLHMRFDAEGPWHNGDALKLAYMVKAAVARQRQDHVLIDLRHVRTPPGAQGRFLICDRLRRALAPKTRVGVIADLGLVDSDESMSGQQSAEIALFDSEPEALDWLGVRSAA
jgi:hypothetical protein